MIEEELKQYILQRYKSIKEFASVANIPYTTLDSILKRGVGKANVLNIIRLCNALEIDTQALAQGVISPQTSKITTDVSLEESEHLKKYRAIDARGRDMVDTVLDKEYERVQEQEELVGIPLVARSGKNEIIKVTRKELEEINKILDEYEADPDEEADKL